MKRSDWQLLLRRLAPADGEDGEDGEDVEREHDSDEEERRKTAARFNTSPRILSRLFP